MILTEADLFFNLLLMIEVVRKSIMHLRRGKMRIVLQNFIYCPTLFVMPGDKTYLDTCARDDGPPPARIGFVFNIRMHDVVNSYAACHGITQREKFLSFHHAYR